MSEGSAQAALAVRTRLRLVHRAASDLRRGVPVLLSGVGRLLILAAETGAPDGWQELRSAAGGTPPVLILAPARAAAILRQPFPADAAAAAIALEGGLQSVETAQSLADPMAPQPALSGDARATSLPPDAAAALALAKIARLLPAVLAVPLDEPAAEETSAANTASRPASDDLVCVTAADVLGYAGDEVAGLRQVASAQVPLTEAPDSRVVAFRVHGSATDHLAIVIGQPLAVPAPLVRLHSECFTGDLLGSLRCDCGEQLRGAIRRIAEDGAGVLLYLAQEGRGIGLVNKLRAYGLQDRGLDTMDANRALGWGADERNFLVGATILQIMGIKRIRLLTNNPEKMEAMLACGIEVAGREPHLFAPNGINDDYLATKAARFGHMLD